MTVTDSAPLKVSSWNRQTYQRLKLALSLGLRRQILVAVCDDLILRNRLVNRLQAEMNTSASTDGLASAELISLNLNLSDPNLLGQIAQWLAQHKSLELTITTFQILGIEQLTRQSADVQRSFLRCLQAMGRNLPRVECSLLLWLPRPWFYTIQQSVPEFWQWYTGVFEFEGEPTPIAPVASSSPEVSGESTDSSTWEHQAVAQENLWQMFTNDFTALGENSEDGQVESRELASVGATLTNDTKIFAQESSAVAEEIAVLSESQHNLSNTSIKLEIEQLEQTSYSAASLAAAYLSVGNYYRERLEQGDASPENLIEALKAYEQVLLLLQEEALPIASEVLNDIGNFYWMLSRYPADVLETPMTSLNYLEESIQTYHLALLKLTADGTDAELYAIILNNLGAAYSDLARYQDNTQNLQLSIQAYEESLLYRSTDALEDRAIINKTASTLNNLGTAYWNLAQQAQTPQCIELLEMACTAYSKALSLYNPEQEPLNWGMIQNNLGTAYWNLAQYSQPITFLELSINAYREALKYRRPDVSAAACAATQNNLGTTYWHIATHYQDMPEVRREYLQMCILAYETAIALAQQLNLSTPPVPVSFDVFATQNNLGLAHYQIGCDKELSHTLESKSTHLQAALQQHLQALQGYSNQPDGRMSTLSYVVKTIRAFYEQLGLQGQNLALSKVPGQLLPEILPQL